MICVQYELEWIQLWHAQRTSQTSPQVLENWVYCAFQMFYLFLNGFICIFGTVETFYDMFNALFDFQWSSLHCASEYLFPLKTKR